MRGSESLELFTDPGGPKVCGPGLRTLRNITVYYFVLLQFVDSKNINGVIVSQKYCSVRSKKKYFELLKSR